MDLFLIVFIDDIIIYSQSEDEHLFYLIGIVQTHKDPQFFVSLASENYHHRLRIIKHDSVKVLLRVSIEGASWKDDESTIQHHMDIILDSISILKILFFLSITMAKPLISMY